MVEPRTAEVVERTADAARRLLESVGPAAVTVRGVARQGGVSKQTVLNRFDSRSGLLDHLVCQGFGDLGRAIRGSKTLTELLGRYRRWALANPGLYRLMLDGPANGLEPSAGAGRAASRVIGNLTREGAFVQMLGELQLELSGLDIRPVETWADELALARRWVDPSTED